MILNENAHPVRPCSQGVGFTLVELLVVITLIVLLLSLLTPALDTAIYRAELVACLANARVQHSAQTLYAQDQNRRFPDRTGTGSPDYHRWGGAAGSPVAVLRYSYLHNLRAIVCPIVAAVPSQSGLGVYRRNDWITTEMDQEAASLAAGAAFAAIGTTYGGWATDATNVYTAYAWFAGFGGGVAYQMHLGEPDPPRRMSDMRSDATFITHRLDFYGGASVHEITHGGGGLAQVGAQFDDFQAVDMPVLFADGHAVVRPREEIGVRMTVGAGDFFLW